MYDLYIVIKRIYNKEKTKVKNLYESFCLFYYKSSLRISCGSRDNCEGVTWHFMNKRIDIEGDPRTSCTSSNKGFTESI